MTTLLEPGDIANAAGDILSCDRNPATGERELICFGIVMVSLRQAEKAAAYGWKLHSGKLDGLAYGGELVTVKRQPGER
jgi:hypothetical protein